MARQNGAAAHTKRSKRQQIQSATDAHRGSVSVAQWIRRQRIDRREEGRASKSDRASRPIDSAPAACPPRPEPSRSHSCSAHRHASVVYRNPAPSPATMMLRMAHADAIAFRTTATALGFASIRSASIRRPLFVCDRSYLLQGHEAVELRLVDSVLVSLLVLVLWGWKTCARKRHQSRKDWGQSSALVARPQSRRWRADRQPRPIHPANPLSTNLVRVILLLGHLDCGSEIRG